MKATKFVKMIAGAVMEVGGAVGSAIAATTADYVQNGLVAMWDGIDNTGSGL